MIFKKNASIVPNGLIHPEMKSNFFLLAMVTGLLLVNISEWPERNIFL